MGICTFDKKGNMALQVSSPSGTVAMDGVRFLDYEADDRRTGVATTDVSELLVSMERCVARYPI